MEKIRILQKEEIYKELKKLPGWQYKDGRLLKTYEFKEFMYVIHLIDRLAPFFEKLDHHADMEIEHRKITFKLWRFDIGMKVTNYDVLEARKIEELAKEYPQK